MLTFTQLARYGIKVEGDMLHFHGNMLDSPTLQYSNDKFTPAQTKAGRLNLVDHRFSEPAEIASWSVIRFDSNEISNANWDSYIADWEKFKGQLEEGIRKYCEPNLNMSNYQIHTGSFPENPNKLKTILEGYKKAGVLIVFVVLPGKDTATYQMLKHVADVQVGIHTVCTVANTRNAKKAWIKANYDEIANLMLKVNLKMGGNNVNLSIAENDNEVLDLLSSTTMIVGADVTHPGPASMTDTDSVAAVVASEDSSFNKYPASIRCQSSKMEMIENFDDMLGERLDHWKVKNGDKYPEKILIYRDGVSEGQFDQVLELEWPQIEYIVKHKYNEAKQKIAPITLITVQKRHHTRFYPVAESAKNKQHCDIEKGNPMPGLLVDTDVTHPHKYDFYLQSHYSLQGTARPAHYVVLRDQIGAKPAVLQKATHWQCFIYGRCTTSISVHPAVRMADMACGRARCYLREYYNAGRRQNEEFDRDVKHRAAWNGGVHPHLENTMFFI